MLLSKFCLKCYDNDWNIQRINGNIMSFSSNIPPFRLSLIFRAFQSVGGEEIAAHLVNRSMDVIFTFIKFQVVIEYNIVNTRSGQPLSNQELCFFSGIENCI